VKKEKVIKLITSNDIMSRTIEIKAVDKDKTPIVIRATITSIANGVTKEGYRDKMIELENRIADALRKFGCHYRDIY